MMTEEQFETMVNEVATLLCTLRADIGDDYRASDDAHANMMDIEDTEISTWFERDRAHVALTTDDGQRTLAEWWDDDVEQAVEAGTLDPRDWHGSAYEHIADVNPNVLGQPAMAVTIASGDGETWVYQTGDNSYTGACYSERWWGVGDVARDNSDDDCTNTARDMVEQIADQMAQDDD